VTRKRWRELESVYWEHNERGRKTINLGKVRERHTDILGGNKKGFDWTNWPGMQTWTPEKRGDVRNKGRRGPRNRKKYEVPRGGHTFLERV